MSPRATPKRARVELRALACVALLELVYAQCRMDGAPTAPSTTTGNTAPAADWHGEAPLGGAI
jgi:hypothetical protein